jgi:hypothetical protein
MNGNHRDTTRRSEDMVGTADKLTQNARWCSLRRGDSYRLWLCSSFTTATTSDTGWPTHERDGNNVVQIDTCRLEAAQRKPKRVIYGACSRRVHGGENIRRVEYGATRTPPDFAGELLQLAERTTAVEWERVPLVWTTFMREAGYAR